MASKINVTGAADNGLDNIMDELHIAILDEGITWFTEDDEETPEYTEAMQDGIKYAIKELQKHLK